MTNAQHTYRDEQLTTPAVPFSTVAYSTAVSQPLITPTDSNTTSEDLPCEKYRQFMDSSVHERTFMIEKLVETFANVIDSIWHPKFLADHQQSKVMPTRGFCNEILKRSKATYSTLQISLFYIFRVKKVVHEKLYQRVQQGKENPLNADMQTSTENQMENFMCCGRRMFLASLMVASKYLHDKNYHNKAWAKITGLDIKEINAAEMAFLNLIDYRLYVSKPTFDKWYTQIHGHIQKSYKSIPLNTPIATNDVKDNANINPTTCSSITSASLSNIPRTIHVSNTDYPSPPPDENTTQATSHPLAPLSPSEKCYERADSGVSFEAFTPPSTIGAKRQWNENVQDAQSKRLCQ